MARILSIVPYRFLPPVNGGHWGVLIVEKIMSVFNEVHTVSTDNNRVSAPLPFQTHFILPDKKTRYLPFYHYSKLQALARQIRPDYLFCHHHYLYPLARKLSGSLGIPLYLRCHNIESERFRSVGKWWWKAMMIFERTAFRHSDAVFFVTREDREWAIRHYRIKPEKAIVMPFGIDFPAIPVSAGDSRQAVAAQYSLNPGIPWLFFMGQLDYGPNREAVIFIIRKILPLLKKSLPQFHILLCGKNLSPALQEEVISVAGHDNIRYLGFVPEIEPLIAACDLMLNPVVSGGGVKTKVVESLAWNKTVVSARSGATGIETSVCGEKLLIAPDHDWTEFVRLIEEALSRKNVFIPDSYFDYYYSEHIARRMQQYFETERR